MNRSKLTNGPKVVGAKASIARAKARESRPTPISASPKHRPKIAATKASIARAKAANSENASSASTANRKRKAPGDPEAQPVTYEEAVASLNRRAAWDLRGRLKDLSQMINLNSKRLATVVGAKKELEEIQNSKDSMEKEAIQKAEELRNRLQEIKQNHLIAVETIHDNQRVKYQKLNDDSASFATELSLVEQEVFESKNKVDSVTNQLKQIKQQSEVLNDSIKTTSNKQENTITESRTTDKEIKNLISSISKNEKEAKNRKEKALALHSKIELLEQKVAAASADKEKLWAKIRDLEEKKKKSKSPRK